MEPGNLFRYELIKNYLALHFSQDADELIILWQNMAIEIIALVGEGGFNSLFERCIDLTKINFPWIESNSFYNANVHSFAALQSCFRGQSELQVTGANNELFITFTDLFASLIGERIAIAIILKAMDNSHAKRSSIKEQQK